MNEIIERLKFEAASYQESFQMLSRAKNLKELAKTFSLILRGSMLCTKVNIYFLAAGKEQWQDLWIKEKTFKLEGLPLLSDEEILFHDLAEGRLLTVILMLDGSRFAVYLGAKLSKKPYDDYDRIGLQRSALLLGSAYQVYKNRLKEKELIFSLNQRVLQLNSLVDTGIEISRLGQGDGILSLALNRVISLTNASRGLLRIRQKNTVLDKIYFPAPFKYKSLEKKGSFISAEFHFNGRCYQFKVYEKESRHGVEPFDSTDRLLLDSFARQVHVTLENHELHQQSLEKQRIERDVAVAATIQQQIIPETLPEIDGYELAGINIPTKFVGGDYYDCIPLGDDRFVLVMADVSGKGIPASLLVSTLNASLSAYLESDFNLAELAQKLNRVIYRASTIDKYITGFIAVLNAATGQLDSLNAGHNPIYLLKNKKLIELKVGGVPFGMMGMDFPYQSENHTMEPGDRLVLYTDGVTEAMNENEEEFDDIIGFADFIKKKALPNVSARQFIDTLINDIQAFTGDTPQSDDITAMYLVRNG